MDNFQIFFKNAMDRNIPTLKFFYSIHGIELNLGEGNKKIIHAIPLDYPDWNADTDEIPYADNSISQIHAYHFLEHCKYPIKVLQECQRVLRTGGHMNICVPYYSAAIASQDLDHKHFFTEETWKTLFKNQYYDKNKIEWKFKIGFNLICGIVERNLCLLTQLEKIK